MLNVITKSKVFKTWRDTTLTGRGTWVWKNKVSSWPLSHIYDTCMGYLSVIECYRKTFMGPAATGQLNFKDKEFWGFYGVLQNLENNFPYAAVWSSYYYIVLFAQTSKYILK